MILVLLSKIDVLINTVYAHRKYYAFFNVNGLVSKLNYY